MIMNKQAGGKSPEQIELFPDFRATTQPTTKMLATRESNFEAKTIYHKTTTTTTAIELAAWQIELERLLEGGFKILNRNCKMMSRFSQEKKSSFFDVNSAEW